MKYSGIFLCLQDNALARMHGSNNSALMQYKILINVYQFKLLLYTGLLARNQWRVHWKQFDMILLPFLYPLKAVSGVDDFPVFMHTHRCADCSYNWVPLQVKVNYEGNDLEYIAVILLWRIGSSTYRRKNDVRKS